MSTTPKPNPDLRFPDGHREAIIAISCAVSPTATTGSSSTAPVRAQDPRRPRQHGRERYRLPGDRYSGMSLRMWDPEREHWTIHWLDSRTPGRSVPPVRGGFDEVRRYLLRRRRVDGRAIRVRYLWSRIHRGTRAGSRPSRSTKAMTGRPTGPWTSQGCNRHVIEHLRRAAHSWADLERRGGDGRAGRLAGTCRLHE